MSHEHSTGVDDIKKLSDVRSEKSTAFRAIAALFCFYNTRMFERRRFVCFHAGYVQTSTRLIDPSTEYLSVI